MGAARAVFGNSEGAPVQHGRTENAKVLPGDMERGEMFGQPAIDEAHAGIGRLVGGEVAEDLDAGFPGKELRNRRLERVDGLGAIVGHDNLDDPVRVGIGQRAQEHGVQHGEHRGIGADGDGEDGDGRQCESRSVAQQAPGMPDVADQPVGQSVHVRTAVIPIPGTTPAPGDENRPSSAVPDLSRAISSAGEAIPAPPVPAGGVG